MGFALSCVLSAVYLVLVLLRRSNMFIAFDSLKQSRSVGATGALLSSKHCAPTERRI